MRMLFLLISAVPMLGLIAAGQPPIIPKSEPPVPDPDVIRIAGMKGKSQRKELRQFLMNLGHSGAYDAIFTYEDRLRPALRALVQDSKAGMMAERFLADLGEPEDLRFIIQHPPRWRSRLAANRWDYFVACSLIDANSDEEWSFLRDCAFHRNRWAENGAIQTLKLIATPKSRELLEEAANHGQFPADSSSFAYAVAYIDSHPPALEGPDLESLAPRVEQALGGPGWKPMSRVRLSERGDRALVDLELSQDRDLYIYTATFYKTGSAWKLHGVRESVQAYLVAPRTSATSQPQ